MYCFSLTMLYSPLLQALIPFFNPYFTCYIILALRTLSKQIRGRNQDMVAYKYAKYCASQICNWYLHYLYISSCELFPCQELFSYLCGLNVATIPHHYLFCSYLQISVQTTYFSYMQLLKLYFLFRLRIDFKTVFFQLISDVTAGSF